MCENCFTYEGNPSLQTAQRVDDIEREARLVDELRFAIDDLEACVNEVGKRCNPVLQPLYAEPSAGGVPTPDVSEARRELYRLHGLAGQLRGILDRLEV